MNYYIFEHNMDIIVRKLDFPMDISRDRFQKKKQTELAGTLSFLSFNCEQFKVSELYT